MPSEAPWLDWELDESSYACTIVSGDLPRGATFTFKRDRDFALDGRVQIRSLSPEAAEAIPAVVHATGQTAIGASVTVCNAFIRNRSGTKDGSFTLLLEPKEIEISFSAASPVRVVEWLGNFGSNLAFPADTNTSVSVSVTRKRPADPWSSSIDLGNSEHWAADHLLLRCAISDREVSFLLGIRDVSKDRAIRPGYIEYLDQGSGLPTEQERELVRAGLSFIFDHQLVLLGDTWFDESHELIRGRAVDGKYLGARYLLRNAAEMPAPIYDESRTHILSEKRVSELLQLFIQQNERFRLDRVAQKMWDARTSTLDTRIARLVATIELLRDVYLGEGESLLPKKQWSKICSALKLTLAEAAKELGVTDEKALTHLANKLPNINFASSTKQFDRFFDSLKLKISDAEQAAMDKRNDQAHGTIYEREHYKQLLSDVRRVQVLLNRVVLALIGHQGAYNDHTLHPCTEVPVGDSSGG